MRKLLVCSFFLGLVSSVLWAGDPFAGTWKFNSAKSKPAPTPAGMAFKEQTMVIEETADTATVTIKGTRENGSAASTKYTTPLKGGPVNYTEGAPPAGVSVATTRIDERTVDFITTRDGKTVSTNHVTVSGNGETMRLDVKGVDPQGKPVQSLIVFDKQ